MTLNLPDDLVARVTAEADRRGVSPDEVLADVVTAGLPPRRRLSFIGVGHSGGREAIAEHHREIVRAHFADKAASDV